MLAAPENTAEPEELAPLMPQPTGFADAPTMMPAAAPAAAPAATSATTSSTTSSTTGAAAPTYPARIDREFVVRNRLVERYIGGRLPLRGAQDLERFCRENPQLLDEIKLSDNIHAALKLLDASGRASPFEPEAKQWWETLPAMIAVAVLAVGLGVTSLVLSGKLTTRDHAIAGLQQLVKAQPLDPATATRPITIIPSRTGPMQRRLVTIGGSDVQMADLKIDVSWTPIELFRITMDRVGQGRVAILHNVKRDSNGNIHLELNSSALGPGDYALTIEGLNWRGDPIPQAWATIGIAH
jgi:hypothetical protein